MEQGRLERTSFMAKIKDLAREIVHKAKNFESDRIEGSYLTLDAHCPKCGALHLKEDYRTYSCETCGFRLFKNIASRQLSPDEVTALVTDRKVGPLNGFRSKTGKPFSAILVLNAENKPEFEFENNGNGDRVVIDPQAALGHWQMPGLRRWTGLRYRRSLHLRKSRQGELLVQNEQNHSPM